MPLASVMSQRVAVTLGACTALLLLAGNAAARDLEPASSATQTLAVGTSSPSAAASPTEDPVHDPVQDSVPTPGSLPQLAAVASTASPSSTTGSAVASTASAQVPIPRPSPTPGLRRPLDRQSQRRLIDHRQARRPRPLRASGSP